jgi:hypothetical protein
MIGFPTIPGSPAKAVGLLLISGFAAPVWQFDARAHKLD